MKFMQLSDIIGKQRELPDFQRKDKVSCKIRGLFIINKRGFHVSKVVREKHLNIIELLLQATEVTARLIEERKLQDCLVLFADCQESAVALGGHIEKLYGMNTKTVGALEQYCECLYQMSVALDEGTQVDVAYEALQQSAKQVEEVYVEEFPDKKEVVFLPYKAAMWDSLESIWMTARDDENSDAYVIPIPYYDVDENRNFKEMHYESTLYPEYVPITSYEEYNLEERHPDMIFIHNPYDEFNKVTSIDPAFYSSKIKDYTEKLVYIPYFVLGEINPGNQEAIDKMSHFCFLPGTMYADTVIVQSENIRQIYINEYIKAMEVRGNKVSREELEKKFLGLGSPKFDKINNVDKDKLMIPDEWKKLIEKEDGGHKKVIFYNTSLTAFLEAGEQMITKIKSVLRFFEENKGEVTLLWRPHPLMKQTVSAMRPDLWEAYEEIVQQYRDEGWGIYDDTPEMNMALAISDAYYGDPSSVVYIYQETRKPIMIQNPEIIDE